MPVLPPRPKSAPLNAMRAFEAAARLGGFKLAAQELNVTAGAVAQQVKQLEAFCGAPLFERHATGVRLNALGQQVLPDFIAAFDALERANQHLSSAAANRLRIAALPSIAQLWLGPRLPRIRRELGPVAISVTALEEPPNLAREPYDLSIFFESNPRKDAWFQSGRDQLLPVCAPKLAARLHSPADMAGFPCLFDLAWPDDWANWLQAQTGIGGFTPSGPAYSLYSMAVSEAIAGAGVLMGHRSLVAPDLASGRLVAPFDLPVDIDSFLTVEKRKGTGRNPMLERLADLLVNGANPRQPRPEKYSPPRKWF